MSTGTLDLEALFTADEHALTAVMETAATLAPVDGAHSLHQALDDLAAELREATDSARFGPDVDRLYTAAGHAIDGINELLDFLDGQLVTSLPQRRTLTAVRVELCAATTPGKVPA